MLGKEAPKVEELRGDPPGKDAPKFAPELQKLMRQMIQKTVDEAGAAKIADTMREWAGKDRDPRFKAVLRIDPLLIGWPKVADQLSAQGYKAAADLGESSIREVRRTVNRVTIAGRSAIRPAARLTAGSAAA